MAVQNATETIIEVVDVMEPGLPNERVEFEMDRCVTAVNVFRTNWNGTPPKG